MLRVGLSGTNWTGKTETIERFVQEHSELGIKTVSLSSLVARCPFPMGERQTVEGSKWMIEQVRAICATDNGQIDVFDRTPIDILAFTLYALNRTGERDDKVLNDCVGLIGEFDLLFYLPVCDGWPADVAATSKQIGFAKEMDRYIGEAIEEFSLEVVRLPWGLDERQALFSEFMSAIAGARKSGR